MLQIREYSVTHRVRSWVNLATLFSRPRRQRVTQLLLPDVSYLDGMALDIAMNPSLPDAIASALTLVQAQVRYTLDAQVFLIVSDPKQTPESPGLTLHDAPETNLSQETADRLLAIAQSTQASAEDSAVHALDDVRMLLLQTLGSGQGFLATIYPHATVSLASLRQYSNVFKSALSRGIAAWHQQQSVVEAALSEERRMHAAELHDSMAQVLAYLRMRTAKLSSLCDQDEHQALKPVAEDISVQTCAASRYARELIANSRLAMNGESLKQALHKAVNEFESRSGIVFELDNRSELGNETCATDDIQILFIVREALSNIVRHSRATHARVVLITLPDHTLVVRVEDNGKGIPAKAPRSDSFGLKIMQERAQRIQALLDVGPRMDGHDIKGTAVCLTIPKKLPS